MSAVTFEITSSPIAAFLGATEVVGAERADDGDLKVYVSARWRGIYVLVPAGERADAIEQAWRGSMCGHLYMRPVPPDDMLHRDDGG